MHTINVVNKDTKHTVSEFHYEQLTTAFCRLREWADATDLEELELYEIQVFFDGKITSTIWMCDWYDLFNAISG